MPELDKTKVVAVPSHLLEAEFAGVAGYTHYTFLVFGFGRIAIISCLRGQASDSHASCATGRWHSMNLPVR